MSAKGRGTTEIVCHDIRPVQPPVRQQLCEEVILYAERHVLLCVLFRLAVTEQVEPVHGARRCEVRRDAVPDM